MIKPFSTVSEGKYISEVSNDIQHIIESIMESTSIWKVILEKNYNYDKFSWILKISYNIGAIGETPDSIRLISISSEPPALKIGSAHENYFAGLCSINDRIRLYDKIMSDVEDHCQASIEDITEGYIKYLDDTHFESLSFYNVGYILAPYIPLQFTNTIFAYTHEQTSKNVKPSFWRNIGNKFKKIYKS